MPTNLPRPSVTLTRTLFGKVKAAAAAEQISVSQWLARAARQRLAVALALPEDGAGAAPVDAGTAPTEGPSHPPRAIERYRDRQRRHSR
jgi:hypothetical protein